MEKTKSIFLATAVIHLFAVGFDFSDIQQYTKPLLMITLLFHFREQTKDVKSPIKIYIFIALIAALAGDSFLMFSGIPEKGILYFLAGLGSFLIMQILYSFVFSKLKSQASAGKNLLRAFLLPGLFFLLILKIIWAFLPPELQVPVVIYALAIAIMVSFSMQLKGSITDRSFLMISTGALLFMISDSLIALNKFTPLLLTTRKPAFWIMLTYILGQSGIIFGLIRVLKTEEK